MDQYNAGLLGDGGGGDVQWWQDYMRAELNRAHKFYCEQTPQPEDPRRTVIRLAYEGLTETVGIDKDEKLKAIIEAMLDSYGWRRPEVDAAVMRQVCGDGDGVS